MLATVDAAGTPHASQAPFVFHQGAFHVLVSALAIHSANLDDRSAVGVLVAADEAQTPEAFARVRAAFDCRCEPVACDSEEWTRICALFRERFGGIVDTLLGLSDFRLVRLRPQGGTWVTGFGQAWHIETRDLEPPQTNRSAD